jgi:hypothetical protein
MSNNVISIYTRRQALSDGCILDVSELAREAGFTWAVAITDHLYHDYIVPALALVAEGQSVQGRLWDTLMCLRHAIRSSKDDTYLRFTVLFQTRLPKPGPYLHQPASSLAGQLLIKKRYGDPRQSTR